MGSTLLSEEVLHLTEDWHKPICDLLVLFPCSQKSNPNLTFACVLHKIHILCDLCKPLLCLFYLLECFKSSLFELSNRTYLVWNKRIPHWILLYCITPFVDVNWLLVDKFRHIFVAELCLFFGEFFIFLVVDDTPEPIVLRRGLYEGKIMIYEFLNFLLIA